jgi:hypothetical protein
MKKALVILLTSAMVCFFSGPIYADLTDGLVAYYPFNGNANDVSGNGHHGTVNAAILAEDRFGNPDSAYDFDGDNDYIWLGDIPSANAMTIAAWIQWMGTPPTGYVILGSANSGHEFIFEVAQVLTTGEVLLSV